MRQAVRKRAPIIILHVMITHSGAVRSYYERPNCRSRSLVLQARAAYGTQWVARRIPIPGRASKGWLAGFRGPVPAFSPGFDPGSIFSYFERIQPIGHLELRERSSRSGGREVKSLH